jgi:hypothetical protein
VDQVESTTFPVPDFPTVVAMICSHGQPSEQLLDYQCTYLHIYEIPHKRRATPSIRSSVAGLNGTSNSILGCADL